MTIAWISQIIAAFYSKDLISAHKLKDYMEILRIQGDVFVGNGNSNCSSMVFHEIQHFQEKFWNIYSSQKTQKQSELETSPLCKI